jgi:hypothetical protein
MQQIDAIRSIRPLQGVTVRRMMVRRISLHLSAVAAFKEYLSARSRALSAREPHVPALGKDTATGAIREPLCLTRVLRKDGSCKSKEEGGCKCELGFHGKFSKKSRRSSGMHRAVNQENGVGVAPRLSVNC